MSKFKFIQQQDQTDCGAVCLKMIAGFYGKEFDIQYLRSVCNVSSSGVTMLDISEAAEKLGFRTTGYKLIIEQFTTHELPCILHWRQNHFVVLYKIKGGNYYIADPAIGPFILSAEEFATNWLPFTKSDAGNALFLKTTPEFFRQTPEKKKRLDWHFITQYLFIYKNLLWQLVIALTGGTLIQLVIPFLTQAIVDIGIATKDISFINIILFSQLMLFLGSTSVDFIRSWILLHISTRVNVSILTDFLIKLMKLPMSFYDTKTTGDILQRINDEKRIETFLTGSTLSVVFSGINFIVFSIIIAYYNIVIFGVFLVATVAYVSWIVLFLRARRRVDFKQFTNYARNQDNLMEIVKGIHEIKLNNAEFTNRWKWEHIQARVFRYNIKSLALDQYQQAGAVFINQGKNILITYLSAKAVIDGQFTLGSMMAIQYIIGQLNAPVEQFVLFIKMYQDARISLERLNEIHQMDDEEPAERNFISELTSNGDITIRNLTFRYPGAGNDPVLKNINISIPSGKTTAIVGMSGSGKTTLLKLLLRYYKPEQGSIFVGDVDLSLVKYRLWRQQCSAVLQEGYIFADSISKNITMSDEVFDPAQLSHAIDVANISDILEAVPYGLESRIGAGGNGISQGQKQRILIGRALYKNPNYVFFDEATNALDANNEKMIVDKLGTSLLGKTVVVVAHRLSTVRNADNIIVLNKGTITEQGTHDQLVQLRGEYFNLIRNQLELGQ